MFLKTVPPVVAIHSEWSKSCSLPLFFNDSASDSDLASASGTPIPQKIQMIIESLHSTQSSDMSENVQSEKAAHSSHEPGCKGQTRLADVSARTWRTGTDAKRQTAGSDSGEDSDSDDSVDRGIEEAIQEYLKEKVDHKRKGDPVTSPAPVAKLQRRDSIVPDAADQRIHSNSGKVLTASNHIQKASTATQPLKKEVKKKKLSKENPFKKADTSKVLPVKCPPLSRSKKGSSSSSEMDRSPARLVIKEEEWLESSSDDGIEEEIQKFQQEKKDKQEGERDTTRSSRNLEDSDSSSDEGIEEAIRRFQEEKHKQKNNKSPLRPAPLVPAQRSKPAVVSPECTSTQPLRTLSKKSSKKKLTNRKSPLPAPLAVSHFLNKCSPQDSKVKGFTPPPTNPQQTHVEHQIHSSLKVNTAELMCAEAILDISKTVMPEVFESNLSIANRNVLQAPTFPAVTLSDDKSNDSSVDSEDGIEQEIRKFLELKAQMNKEPSLCSGDPSAGKEPKKKTKETQPNKAARLSLTRKRKFKEEQSIASTDGDVVCNVKEEQPEKIPIDGESTRSQIPELSAPPTVTSHSSSVPAVKNNKPKPNSPARKVSDDTVPKDRGSTYSKSSPPDAPRTAIGSERNDSSDKSSSLDSDEDLDAAIKDLLKTKKKVKKKVRDLKARKGSRPAETSTVDTLKKHKPATDQKNIPPAKTVKPGVLKVGTLNVQAKSNKNLRSKAVKSRPEAQNSKHPASLTHTDSVTGNGGVLKGHDQEGDAPSSVPRAEDEDSCVDSDDSIEQEIRRFLAERAKVATPVTASVKQEEDDVQSLTTSAECDVKSEHQQISFETPASVSASASGRLWNNETQAEKESKGTPSFSQRQTFSPSEADKGPVLTPGSSCIMGFRRTENQKLEISTTREPKNGSSQKGKDSLSNTGTPVSHTIKPNSFTSPFSSSASGHRHQNLFLMTPGNSRMNELKEHSSADCNELLLRHRSRPAPRIPLRDVISSVCSSPFSNTKPLISSPAEKPAVDLQASATPGSRTEEIYSQNHTMKDKKDRHLSDKPHLSPVSSHLCQPQPSPVLQPHLGSSSVTQVHRDQTPFLLFSAQKTNQVQVRQTELSESRVETQKVADDRKEEKEQDRHMEKDEEEKCVDETDVESDEDRKGQRMKAGSQHHPNQSFSTYIDPGFLLSPYIALSTEERRLKFQSRRLQALKQLQASTTVKRRLQFVVSVPR